jgi:L-lactate dehydrogenase complex protein LldG
MTSREEILGKVRKNIGRDVANEPAARAAIDAAISARVPGPRPKLTGDLLARFRDKSEALSTTVDIVADWSAVPAAVARYLDGQGLPKRAVGWPLACGHDWNAAGIAFEGRGAVDADLVGITGCYCAVAETGTLMLLSGADTPASVSLLPETHVAVLAASRRDLGHGIIPACFGGPPGEPTRFLDRPDFSTHLVN